MDTALQKILDTPYAYVVSRDPDDGSWVIAYPDLPGCMSHADDPADIDTMARGAFEAWVTARYEDGAPVPPPAFSVDNIWDQNWEAARHPAMIPSITTEQAARRLGLTSGRVRQLIRTQGLGVRHGRAVLISERELDALRDRPAPGRPRIASA